MTSPDQSRIRWDPAEINKVATEILRLQALNPAIAMLDAVRQAQKLLEPHRQRELKAWTIVQARVEPRMLELKAEMKGRAADARTPPITRAIADSPPAANEQAGVNIAGADSTSERASGAVDRGAQVVAGAVPAMAASLAKAAAAAAAHNSTGLGPLEVEASLVVAIQSPAVERALVDVLTRSMAQAFARIGDGGAIHQQVAEVMAPRAANTRVLLVGFQQNEARSIELGLSAMCEVRVLKANQPHMLNTLAGICSVAIVPDEIDDEVVSVLQSRELHVVRHSGSTARLVERMEELLQGEPNCARA